MNRWFPTNKSEMKSLGLKSVDFVIVTGDVYIDHPSFGVAIIARTLEKFGYSIAILSQPNYKTCEEFKQFGKPNLGFLVTSGNIESMVNHYSVNKKRRKTDIYTVNGKNNKRPDRAVIVYSKLCREAYEDSSIVIGGIEASLRRLSHYDYWSNTIMKSILIDSNADLLVYGMAENTIVEVAEYLKSGIHAKDISFIQGTTYKTNSLEYVLDYIKLPDFNDVSNNKDSYAKSFKIQYENTDSINGKRLVEKYKNCYIVQNPAAMPLSEFEMDQVYNLDYNYDIHPTYKKLGTVKALDEVKFSLTVNRGCAAGCSFCALTFHQGKVIQSISVENIVNEAIKLTTLEDFKGNINDVGGPTANFLDTMCEKQVKHGVCNNKKCIGYNKCSELNVTHEKYLEILNKLRTLDNVKNVFIRSGIRYDYVMYDKNEQFFNNLVKFHTSGQLRVAPEHIDDNVLKLMGKPSFSLYKEFVKKFDKKCIEFNKDQYVVPYLMSSHPGSTVESAIKLAEYLHEINYQPLQVQDFYPTPGTLSTVMYYTEKDPLTNQKVYVSKSQTEKEIQRALMQYKNPENYYIVKRALLNNNRADLIGLSKNCLIAPRQIKKSKR